MKAIGGKIKDWQLHPVVISDEKAQRIFRELGVKYWPPSILSGYITNDYTGRYFDNEFMYTSYVIQIDLETGVAETAKTFYELVGLQGEGKALLPTMNSADVHEYYDNKGISGRLDD